MFDIALDGLCDWIRSRGWSRVALQMPEGVKSQAQGIIDELEKRTHCSYVVMGDPCYGACDLSRDFLEYADALVQFGHSRIPSLPAPDNVLFIEMRAQVALGELLDEALPFLGPRVGLVATLQYLGLIDEAKARLTGFGKEVHIGQGDGRITYPGQVLGCNHTSAAAVADAVDSFLYIGEGDFHALAVALGTDLPVLILDPVRRELRSLDDSRDRLLRQRFAAITLASDAKDFIVIVSSKTGQRRMDLARKAVRSIESKGKRADIVVLEQISPEALLHYRADAYVSTACPRVAIDDAGMYRRPMLTPPELEIALGEREWDDYIFDMIEG